MPALDGGTGGQEATGDLSVSRNAKGAIDGISDGTFFRTGRHAGIRLDICQQGVKQIVYGSKADSCELVRQNRNIPCIGETDAAPWETMAEAYIVTITKESTFLEG
ncbi:hypothetical protein AT959_06930 [Dechloromonas denitrificans]|uniref:Uncharacterized protein n=1 Tax=Dechloromonas denitrificans TaxID=281362 RepID=A0A133XKE9_9RHOO|nr:hypothetical protein AT959_06930 [Dechloromonas denitrificans]